jgi:hypothetical protein
MYGQTNLLTEIGCPPSNHSFRLPLVYLLIDWRFREYAITIFVNITGNMFLSARKADLKKGFQHLVLVLVVLVVGTRVKKGF